jgi:hypothetical protein
MLFSDGLWGFCVLVAAIKGGPAVRSGALVVSAVVEKHVAGIFGKLGLPPAGGNDRRVLAVLRYLGS